MAGTLGLQSREGKGVRVGRLTAAGRKVFSELKLADGPAARWSAVGRRGVRDGGNCPCPWGPEGARDRTPIVLPSDPQIGDCVIELPRGEAGTGTLNSESSTSSGASADNAARRRRIGRAGAVHQPKGDR